MRFSNLFCPTLKEDPAEAETISHRLMLRGGMIRQIAAGIYDILPVGLKVIRRVEKIVREEMNRAGAQELYLPAIQPSELWKESGRWDQMGKEMLRIKDRGERDYVFGPTHEEVITDLVRREIKSYRDLPRNLYQIQVKFRDEVRPRFGLMRGREFLMKDSYSFDVDDAGASESYKRMYDAYNKIFTRCGLKFAAVDADSGNIGGSQSQEFMVLASSGEDQMVRCTKCDFASNVEKATGTKTCPKCGGSLKTERGIEVGHIFKLGTKYSDSMKALFTAKDGSQKPMVMGCYGIGIGRTAAAAIEQNHDDRGIIFPPALAPFDVAIIPIEAEDKKLKEPAEKLYADFQKEGFEPLLDDREAPPGKRFKDIDLIGIPIKITIGEKGLTQGKVEVKLRREESPQMIEPKQVVSFVREKLKS